MYANNTGIKLYAEISHDIPGLYIFVGGQIKEPLKIFYITDIISENACRTLCIITQNELALWKYLGTKMGCRNDIQKENKREKSFNIPHVLNKL